MMEEAGASFALYSKKARADFLFQREKRFFCVFSSLLSVFGDRVEFFFLNRTAEKRLHFRDLSVE
jgi:hypothetical protein